MSRARSVADLGNQNVLSVSATNGNINVGTGVTLENTGEAQFSGIVTAPSIDTRNLIGDVSIGGVLTYEDVTSVDSVGIVTAGNGLRVTDGGLVVTAGISTFAGITTVTGETLFTKQLNVSGVSTLGSNVVVGGATTELVVTGDARVTGILTVGTASLTLDGATGNVSGASLHDTQVSAISKEITDTATDVFVYDTSKDSDGGAWRKRTTHTSWYNETLGTATRGTRKEFPAVAVIVADATTDKVTIYDGDDPDLPMWMVISAANPRGILGWATSNYTRFKVAALNGILTSVSNDGGHLFKFVEDYVEIIYSSTNYPITSSRTIGGRNDPKISGSGGGATRTYVAVTYAMNDVAMTVLPNAPVDSATGLPIPTIAVATDSGLSIINDDGTVSSPLSGTHVGSTIDISDDFVLYYGNESQGGYYPYDVKTATYISNARFFSANVDGPVSLLENLSNSTNQDIAFTGDDGQSLAIGMDNGLNLIKGNPRDGIADNGMVAYATTSYNTGWMQGNVKGAFLSGISTANVSASTNLVTNGTFDSDNSSWDGTGISAYHNSHTTSQSSGYLILNSGSGGYYGVSQDVTTVTGTEYMLSFDIVSGGTGNGAVRVGNGNLGENMLATVAPLGVGSHSFSFVAGSQSFSKVFLGRDTPTNGGANATVRYDNIVVRELTEQDRSVNNNKLAVFGTITKSPVVGTGVDAAELVAYSGFSASNYLQQPYNSALAPGTAAYSVSCWVKTGTSSGDQYIFDRSGGGPGSRNLLLIMQSAAGNANRLQWWHRDNSGNVTQTQITDKTVTDNVWHQIVALNDGSNYRVYVDGEVSSITNNPATDPIRNVISDNNPPMFIGVRHTGGSTFMTGSMALFRYSLSAPSPEQIKKMYEDEKVLFQSNANATLYGSSDAVTALAYDDTTELLHVGTSSGRSEFQGLRRINNTTTAVTTAISASNDLVAEK